MPATKATSVRLSLPALDLTLTPEVVSQITRWLPQVAQVAMRMDLPITAKIEDKTGDLIPRRVLRIEVGARDDAGKISGISVPIILERTEHDDTRRPASPS